MKKSLLLTKGGERKEPKGGKRNERKENERRKNGPECNEDPLSAKCRGPKNV